MEIFQFEQFRAIVKCGTMREAAEELYLSQPTLSYSLKKLESELDCKLFTRVHNQLRLSPYGEIVLEHTKDLAESMERMLQAIEEAKRREAATLHIGCFSHIVSTFLLSRVATELTDSTFDVVNCATADLVSGLKSERFDVLIATDICRDASFEWRKLYSEQAYISAPRESAIAKLEKASSSDLVQEQFSIEAGLAGYSDWYAFILKNAGVAEEAIERVPYKEHLRKKDTLPTCNLVTSFIMDYVRTNESRLIVPIDEPFAHRRIGLLYRADASDKVVGFVEYMKANAADLFSGNAFIPYLVFPDDSDNLHITNE